MIQTVSFLSMRLVLKVCLAIRNFKPMFHLMRDKLNALAAAQDRIQKETASLAREAPRPGDEQQSKASAKVAKDQRQLQAHYLGLIYELHERSKERKQPHKLIQKVTQGLKDFNVISSTNEKLLNQTCAQILPRKSSASPEKANQPRPLVRKLSPA